MASLLLGLDFGTGGAKGCIMGGDGDVRAYSFREYPIINSRPGWSEHDAGGYWTVACDIIKDCILQAGANPAEIAGVAVSSALPCMVMIDREGQPLQNAYNLMDRRATAEVALIKEKIGERAVFEVTGNRLDDHPSLVNLLWERSHRPDTFRRVHKILTIEGYIVFRLTGAVTLSRQNAAFVGVAYDIRRKRFDAGILKEIGIDSSLLPELRGSREIAGKVSGEAAAASGLASGTPVAVGQADFNAACIASGVTEVGDIQCNLGTCGNFGVVTKSTNFMFEMISMSFTVGEEDTYITIPTTTTGGMSIRYLRDTFGRLEVETERVLGVDSYDLLNLEAQKVPPGSQGLVVLPYLMGERTPIWDVHARGCIFGLSLQHTKGHFVRAMMEGVAYALYDSFRLIQGSGVRINFPIVMHEGGAKSMLWRQIITDLFETPTVLTRKRTGAPLGDAILAGVAVGMFPDFSMCKRWAQYVQPMEPIPENTALYRAYFSLFKDLYAHVKEDYVTLARLNAAP